MIWRVRSSRKRAKMPASKPRRIGPPLTAPDEQLRGRIIIRYSPLELAILERACGLDGATRAAWVREQSLRAARRRIAREAEPE